MVRKTIGIVVRVIWLGVCVAALLQAHKGYQGTSDWKTEEGLLFEMMALSFPSSWLVVGGVIAVGITLGFFGLALPSSSRTEMTATWLLFVLAGYVQWFVVVPKALRWREQYRKEQS